MSPGFSTTGGGCRRTSTSPRAAASRRLVMPGRLQPSHDARYRRVMAITSVLDIRLRTDAPADAESRISSILSQTRVRPGFLSADVVRDLDDPWHLVVIEVWESLEADTAYRAWRATPEGASELGELTAGQIALTRYEPTTI